jgi:hypothetical protein
MWVLISYVFVFGSFIVFFILFPIVIACLILVCCTRRCDFWRFKNVS